MVGDKFSCSGCSRGCLILITEQKGNIYLSGNKCIGGEQKIRQHFSHFADQPLLKAEDLKKKGLLHILFKR